MTRTVLGLLVVCGLVAIAGGLRREAAPAESMQQFAVAWLESLPEQMHREAVMDYDAPERVGWHFIPKEDRKGVPLREMNPAQQTAALRLVRAALSEVGYDKASQIMLLEGVLRELEGPGSEERRDPRKYYVTIFGDPSKTDEATPWGLSFEGHHLSLNFVCRGEEIVDSTPQFLAANPAEIKTDVSGRLGKGTRVLRLEETLAFELVNRLSEDQLGEALIAEEAPAEIRFAGEAQPKVTKPAGIAYLDLAAAEQKLLKQLIEVYNGTVPETVQEKRLELIDAAGWDQIHFAWAGAREPGIGHYYRITGPSFLIEFVNTQPDAAGNPANHIHCVWRDMSGDFDLPLAGT